MYDLVLPQRYWSTETEIRGIFGNMGAAGQMFNFEDDSMYVE